MCTTVKISIELEDIDQSFWSVVNDESDTAQWEEDE